MLVGPQGLLRATVSGQPGHPLGPKPLPEREFGREHFEIGQRTLGFTGGEQGIHPPLAELSMHLVQPGRRRLSRLRGRSRLERRSPPKSKSVVTRHQYVAELAV